MTEDDAVRVQAQAPASRSTAMWPGHATRVTWMWVAAASALAACGPSHPRTAVARVQRSAPEHLLQAIVSAANGESTQMHQAVRGGVQTPEALLLRFELREAGLEPRWVRLGIVWTEREMRVIEREPLDLQGTGGLPLEVLGAWKGPVEELCAAPWETVRLDTAAEGTLARSEMAPLLARASAGPAEPCRPVAVSEVAQVAVVGLNAAGQLLLLESPLDLASQAGMLDVDNGRPRGRLQVRVTALGE